MTSRSKRKGDRAELEVQALVGELLGVPARRALGAGRLDDVGDIGGVPRTVIQVCDWSDVTRAVREKPVQADQQKTNANADLAATFVRLRGGIWRVVLTPEQWADHWLAATQLDAAA